MRIQTLLALLLVIALAGCGSVRDVHTGTTAEIEQSRVNRTMRGRLARVYMNSGEKIYGAGVRVAPDSTSWVDPQSATYVVVATDDVSKITLMRAGQGALVGIGAGLVVGVATGILRANLEGDDPVGQPISLTQSEKMTVLPLAHSAYASLVTTPLGAIIGRKNTFRLVAD